VEIHEFFVEGQDQSRSHVLLHITEPSTPQEEAKGYFFALAEINNGTIEQIQHLQQMIDDLESGYYETDDTEDKTAFEATLEFINCRGHHLLQFEDSLIHCLVGVIRDRELHFAYHGSPQAVLFYRKKDNELEAVDILGAPDNLLNNNQLFSSILEGHLNLGDYFYASTPHVNDYFTLDRIKKIVETRNARQSAGHIQKVLDDIKSDLSFGGIFFHLPTYVDLPKTGKTPKSLPRGTVESLNKMISREKNTAEMLSPSLWRRVNKRLNTRLAVYRQKHQTATLDRTQTKRQKQISKTMEKGKIETNVRPRQEKINEPILNIILVSLGKSLFILLSSLWRLLRGSTILLARTSVALFFLLTNRDNQRETIRKEWRQAYDKKKDDFFALPLLSKILLILTIVLAVIFVGSLTTFKLKSAYQAKKIAYENQIQAVIDKKNAADSSLLYNDEARAFILLAEAKELLDKLIQDSHLEKEKASQLAADIETSLTHLRKWQEISPTLIADLNPNQAKVEQLIIIANQILAFGPDDKHLYRIEPLSGQINSLDASLLPKLIAASVPKENDYAVFLGSNGQIAKYDPETQILSQKDISYPQVETKILSPAIYNRRLYVVDTQNNQIYKHSPIQTGFDRGTAWLEEELNLSDAISLAIDGDIYILKTTGEIWKLADGLKQEFNPSGLDPQLENPRMFYTNASLNELYILEPKNKRLVILDKTGKLLGQYTSPIWTNPTGFIVDNEKNIFLLDNNKVYRFAWK